MNLGILSGFISSDIKSESLTLKDGKTMEKIKFSIACKRDFSEGTDFIWVEALGKNATNISKFFSKGRGILVRYHIQTGEYTNKEGKKIYTESKLIDSWDFPPVRKSEENGSAPQESTSTSQQSSPQPAPDDNFMDIPQNIADSLPFR